MTITGARGFVVRALSCTALCGACVEQASDVGKPTPPDMSALVAVYDAPTGTFDPKSAQQVLALARRLDDQISTLGIDALLLDFVQDTASALAEAGAERTGEGYLAATRTCAGWEAEPAPQEGHGRIELLLGFGSQGLDPVSWGEAIACEYLAGDRRILLYGPSGTLAGTVRLAFAATVPFDRVALEPVLLDLDATAEVDDVPQPAKLDFRTNRSNRTLELRVPVDGGDIVVVTSEDELTGVRARNGDFVCDAAANCVPGD